MPRLVDLSVRAFVEAVASADQPVPAGGSVAALTAASSAALLALVCGVLQRKQPGALSESLRMAQRLQSDLLALVDEDADAFRAFLTDRHSEEVVARVGRAPLQIGQACLELIELSQAVEVHTTGPMLGDVHAARLLAAAALRTALEIAEQNVALHQDPSQQQALRDEISRLRSRQVR